jgi:hypothetical protein
MLMIVLMRMFFLFLSFSLYIFISFFDSFFFFFFFSVFFFSLFALFFFPFQNSYRGPVVRRDWDKIAQRRAELRAAKSPEDRAELRKKFRLEDAMAGDAQATSDPLFMPRTKSSKQQKIVVQPTDAFGLGAYVGPATENLPQQQQQQQQSDASPVKVKSASHAKKMQREQEERRMRLQVEQEKLLREQAVEIPTVLSNAPPPSRLTDARALFRTIMTRKIPILSGADVDERLNGFNIELDDTNWASGGNRSLRAAQPADASDVGGEQRAIAPVEEQPVDNESDDDDDDENDEKHDDEKDDGTSSSSTSSRSLIGAASATSVVANEKSVSDDELDDDDDEDLPTMELPRGPSAESLPTTLDGYYSPPPLTQTQQVEPEPTMPNEDEEDDADEDEEVAAVMAPKKRALKRRDDDGDENSSDAAMTAATMLDDEADEVSGDDEDGGADADEDEGDLIDDGVELAPEEGGIHAQLTFEHAMEDGGFDDAVERKRKRGSQHSDEAEDDGSHVARRRRRGSNDAAASSDDDDGGDDEERATTAGVRPPSMDLREIDDNVGGDDDDGGVGAAGGDPNAARHDDESEEVDEATMQRFRERAQARAAKHDFFATHAEGLVRSQSNSLFPISDDHSQHPLARAVLHNESSQLSVAPTRTRSVLRSSSFLLPVDIDLQPGRSSAGPIESLFSKVVGRADSMAPPPPTAAAAAAARPASVPTPLSPMSRSKSMSDVAVVSHMRRTFSARNPQRLRELMSSHNRVVQNTSSRSVIFASDSQDARTQPGVQPPISSSGGGGGGALASTFFAQLNKSK